MYYYFSRGNHTKNKLIGEDPVRKLIIVLYQCHCKSNVIGFSPNRFMIYLAIKNVK